MNWRDRLRSAWGALPARLRRLVIGAVIAGVVLIILAFVGPREIQLFAVGAIIVLFLLVQGYILWHLWQQNPTFRQARRAFVQGDFDETIRLLEESRSAGKLDATGGALLGNAYRQLGRLDDSEQALRAAYEIDPESPFPAYGLGRTLLARGHYEKAVSLIAHALDRRGPATILADLGHAQYRAGMNTEAVKSLKQADELQLEPHRALMTVYLLWKLGSGSANDTFHDRLRRYDHGLEAWQSEAERFRQTPYGRALTADIGDIQNLLAEYNAS